MLQIVSNRLLKDVQRSHMYVERNQALGSITSVTVEDQGIVEIVPIEGYVSHAFIVFSLAEGQTTIIVTYDGGATDIITVEVNANREIVAFDYETPDNP